MSIPHLSTEELAERWRVAARTVKRWRSEGIGPRSVKVARSVRYRLDDVERFERGTDTAMAPRASSVEANA
ncbi:helix-turn-helix domain-containing protein [Lysobacter sp. ISL-50]|uniref:helix-turn-helix transcriptional regulator n=1 Tax=unclassified Lysobacter TaxID=2635362 RepID=UPI001BECA8A6|nr:helix-turn-helix domain-containing protein [Lysobacter sp. ISL-42]MBT2749855.1 helix-turn-helix domain-containing protein [Lysobacter sp. ISL-50]MBT2781183.1 helix-turn-helix domain-containing protein [Lysobacter sp. ISL-52]